MMATHMAFYTDLFSRGNIDLESQQELFSHVTSRLSEAESSSCECPLTLAEVSEFYAHFLEKLGSLLVDVFNQGLVRGKLPIQ